VHVKIHEYQAKELLKGHGVPVQDGYITDSVDEIDDLIAKVQEDFNSQDVVVKAQIHAGGRGKGRFKELGPDGPGGVKYCPNGEVAKSAARQILGNTLVTKQTGPDGQKVRKIYISEAIDIAKEYYVAITLDRSKEQDVIIVSTEGGMDIEAVAEETPDKIVKEWVDDRYGLQGFQIRRIVANLELSGKQAKQAGRAISTLYKAYKATDAAMVEINPLVETADGDVLCLDSKVSFDSNAMYRQKAIAEMRDIHEEDPAEVEAGKFNLNYIKLDGNVGCMVNGAGLAMGTMDIIKLKGGDPANFLDVGGAASAETVKNGFRIILADDAVKAVLINIFGGIVRCDRVANGIVQAVQELDLDVPVVVRLAGTNAEEAKQILADSGVSIVPASSLDEAATKVVELAIG
jgi:succinyl-CoA synthetase beta subunit